MNMLLSVLFALYLGISESDAQCTFHDIFQNSVWQDSMKGNLTFTTNSMTGYFATAYGVTTTSYLRHCVYFIFTDAQCTFPGVFQNSVWLDSMKGTLTFTTNSMTGYSVTAYGVTTTSWVCYDETYFTSENILILRSSSTFTAATIVWYTYLCFQMTTETSNSYTYYNVAAQEPNAGQERVFVRPSSTTYPKEEICNTAVMATGSAFVTMIKQGSESAAKVQCPTPLLGRFDFSYTDAAGSTFCSNASNPEHMNVCTDKTTLTFDRPCAEKSIVYATGSVYCIASKQVGTDTFVVLYNPENTVDDITTFRFACMVISEDSTQATVVYNNCTDHMTSTTVARDHAGNTIGSSVILDPYVFCQGGCYWPTAFRNSVWRDNTRGDLTFTDTSMTGFSFTSYGTTVNNWECLDNSTFTSDGVILLKSTDTIDIVGLIQVPYLCLRTTAVVPDVSYYYYQMHDQESNAAYERVLVSTSGTLTDRATICSALTVPTAEFHFMLKSGSESSAKQTCPGPLLAKMDYNYTSDTGTPQCQGTIDNWDVCTDRQVMTFDYNTCSQQMAYSAIGIVWCVGGITNTHEYVIVYNTDTSPTYRFTCFVVSSDGLTASMVYNNCTITQTPTTYAKSADGTTNIGALLTMTRKETCPLTTTTTIAPTTTTVTSGNAPTTTATPNTGSSSEEGGGGGGSSVVPMVAGAVVGVLAIAAILIVAIYCLKKKKSSSNGVSHSDIEKIVPTDVTEANGHTVSTTNGHVVNTNNGHAVTAVENPGFTDNNPALTANPERNTLTPLPPRSDTIEVAGQRLPPIRS